MKRASVLRGPFSRLLPVVLTLCATGAWASETEPSSGVPDVPDVLVGEGKGDGVYGRFAGNVSLSPGVGVSYQSRSREFLPSAKLTGRFYQAVGLYVGFSQAVTDSPPLTRVLELGLTLEPLFLLRFNKNAEWGRPMWDLMVDSLSLSLGAHLSEPFAGNMGDLSGFILGLGAGVPLTGRAPGPWVRIRGGMQTGGPSIEGTAELLLEWQWMLHVFQQKP